MHCTVTNPSEASSAIGAARQKIADALGIPPERQRIVYWETELADDGRTLATYDVQHDSMLRLTLRRLMEGTPMQIIIRTSTGKNIPLQVYHSDTVEEVKKLIEEREGIPSCQQWLVFNNGPQLVDERTLSDYNVVDGAEVHLVLRLSGD